MQIIGRISPQAAAAFEKSELNGADVWLGKSNLIHMQESHPDDYRLFGEYIREIITLPDYVAVNPKDKSLEFVKTITLEDSSHVKVAVRATGSGRLYARSLYTLNPSRVEIFIRKGTLKKV
jgi:hypothetical protein